MAEKVVADVRYRWNMSVEARLLVVVTLALLALGLGTVYSASAVAAEQAGQSSATFFLKQLLCFIRIFSSKRFFCCRIICF